MEELIKESTNLYNEIDDCITNLIKSRFDKDEKKKNEAIFKMGSLLVNTMQHISWLVGTMKEYSLIKWQTGEPKKKGEYLVNYTDGSIGIADYHYWKWQFYNNRVVAWSKLSDIEPYKKEKK